MRPIKYIVLHCTATPQTTSVQNILDYWKNAMQWKNPGYHYLIEPDGRINNLLPIEEISNGVAGYNQNSIHISYIGGVDDNNKAIDNRTPQQVISQINLLIELTTLFPNAIIQGHRDFPNVKKECPSFNVKEWLKHVGFKNH